VIGFFRHAEAGKRHEWKGPDRERPLSEAGERQAKAVAERLAADGVARIVSSPYVRCIESVEPLAAATGLEIEIEPGLAEGADPDMVHDLLLRAEPGTVFCSHGDIASGVLRRLAAEGADLDAGLVWEKGSTWRLERDARGKITRGRYSPPPPTD
jgi:8-oxo-dGTP diphosphatase